MKDLNIGKVFYNKFGNIVIPERIIDTNKEWEHKYLCKVISDNNSKSLYIEYSILELFESKENIPKVNIEMKSNILDKEMSIAIEDEESIRIYDRARDMGKVEKKNNKDLTRRNILSCMKYGTLDIFNKSHKDIKIYKAPIVFH